MSDMSKPLLNGQNVGSDVGNGGGEDREAAAAITTVKSEVVQVTVNGNGAGNDKNGSGQGGQETHL